MTQIKVEMAKLRAAFEIATTDLITEQQLYDQHKFDMLRIEKKIQREVATETKGGTTVIAFTNDLQRNSEIFKRLQEDPNYQTLVGAAGAAEDKLTELKFEREKCWFNLKTFMVEVQNENCTSNNVFNQ